MHSAAAKYWLHYKSQKTKSFLMFCVFLVFLLTFLGNSHSNDTFQKSSTTSRETTEPSRETTEPMEKIDGLWQGDSEIITSLSRLLLPPSWAGSALDNPKREDFSDYGQSAELASILKNKNHGYFIEARAGDGEKGSVSLFFERKLNWRGLLVEDDFKAFGNLILKERNSYAIYASLSTTERIKLIRESTRNKDWIDPSYYHWEIPLYSLYLVMGSKEVDLLVLDTNGTELQILQTVPWESVKIRVMCIAYTHIPGNPRALPEYLSLKGYTLLKTHVKDMFFASKEFLEGQS
ncbi:uncharacterized protein [Palaemon carinicauda]